MTNLRLPGQYDERLLGSLGLQGPYYNWNRWYLPGVGRYVEVDPIALAGQLNGEYGPDWYAYAVGNPGLFIDPLGLGANDWWDPEFYWRFWGNCVGAGVDFWRNYWDMRDASHKGADKYFHCKANCQASARGFGGTQAAAFISESRELFDEYIKRYPPQDCQADRAANAFGRCHPPPCDKSCAPYRPRGLPPKY